MKTTLKAQFETTIGSSAASAWRRAQIASRCRHGAIKRGDLRAARQFGQIKVRAVLRVFQLAPDRIQVKLQWWRTTFLVSVEFAGEALHLPIRTAQLFGLSHRNVAQDIATRPVLVA